MNWNMRIVIILTVLLFSCKKSNISSNKDWIGKWNAASGSTTYNLNVESNGQADYEEISTSKKFTTSGKFYLDGSTLKIGVKKYTVNSAPVINNSGKYQTTLDGVIYNKN